MASSINLVNATASNGCPALPGSNTLARPSTFKGVGRRCGNLGSDLNLEFCCDGGLSMVEVQGDPGNVCAYLCPYKGTLQQWRDCIAYEQLEVFCIDAEAQGVDASPGAPLILNTSNLTSPSPTSSQTVVTGHAAASHSRSIWSTILAALVILAILVPGSAHALPSPSLAHSELAAPLTRRSGVFPGCGVLTHSERPYLAFDLAEPSLVATFNVTTAQTVKAPTQTLSPKILSTFPPNISSADLAAALHYFLNPLSRIDTGLPTLDDPTTNFLGNLTTSYEAWARNHTRVQLFLQRGYYCIDATVKSCQSTLNTPLYTQATTGRYCFTQAFPDKVPIAYWRHNATSLS
ncbi:hypothetical protein OC835_006504 [Tilletia horrida]|nr:hypothetical protein OC835_006504 [Tilletia horrida]